ncbi:alpha/beta fold hydrolase [Undibacterium sp. JH2W]|uniref:alpha/beta fold hydrolase n=1 Tax=Undibacterium sp. JH2W TaxID=3413037 RepID=UPI003BF114B5
MSTPQFLLIPGFMCDASLWKFMLPGLQQLGQVHFADLNQGDSIENMAMRLLTDLPVNGVIVGFSLGGYVARHLAWLAHQQGISVRGLVLLNTSARASTLDEDNKNRQQIKLLTHYPYKGQTLTALRRALHPQRQDDDIMLAHLQAMSLSLGKQVFLQQLAIVRADGHHELPDICCPSMIVASRKDQMRRLDEAEKLARGLPHAELHIIEDCGHMSPLEKAPELLQLLRTWLENQTFNDGFDVSNQILRANSV